jgi:hypothetical protein
MSHTLDDPAHALAFDSFRSLSDEKPAHSHRVCASGSGMLFLSGDSVRLYIHPSSLALLPIGFSFLEGVARERASLILRDLL